MVKESRSLEDLQPEVKAVMISFISRCEMEIPGLRMIVCCTLRPKEVQDALYLIGRRNIPNEKIVTNCKGGDSYHQYGVAADFFPTIGGKPILFENDGDEVSDPIWQKIGSIGEECGLEWAGRWKHNREAPHFQYTGGRTIAQLKEQNGFA